MKIDVVYTWVDGSDPNWKMKKQKKLEESGVTLPEANSAARFMDNNELKYSLRSIHKFAPWVNKIFIVTDNQVPQWLNTAHPKIQIVDHSEIFSDKSFLPTFSARVIESQLHHIANLSEHFIYFNDDMFLGNSSSPDQFFVNNKMCRVFVSELIAIPNRKAFDITLRDYSNRNDHQHAIVNTRKIIKERFNRSIYSNIRHGAKALLKSVLYELEDEFKEALTKTNLNHFRTEQDILMIHLFEYYSILKGHGKTTYLKTVKPGKFSKIISGLTQNFSFAYLNLHDTGIEKQLGTIRQTNPFMICLNHTPQTPQSNLELVKKFMPEFYPDKSPFEK